MASSRRSMPSRRASSPSKRVRTSRSAPNCARQFVHRCAISCPFISSAILASSPARAARAARDRCEHGACLRGADHAWLRPPGEVCDPRGGPASNDTVLDAYRHAGSQTRSQDRSPESKPRFPRSPDRSLDHRSPRLRSFRSPPRRSPDSPRSRFRRWQGVAASPNGNAYQNNFNEC